MCGHFLVPFWTFFGATVLGKAVIKMHFQKFFVIIIFNAFYLEYLLSLLGSIPKLGPKIQPLFRDMLEKQKEKLHRKPGDHSVLVSWPGIDALITVIPIFSRVKLPGWPLYLRNLCF